MSEIFPTQVRSTGLSIGYALGVTIFGGFAPTIVEDVHPLTGDKLAPSYYVLLAAVLSGVSLAIVAWRMRARAVRGRSDRRNAPTGAMPDGRRSCRTRDSSARLSRTALKAQLARAVVRNEYFD